jgi:hypothetical protein
MIVFPKETVMKVTGGCHCGHITYDAEVDPACHCTDCQKLTGTAFRATITSLPKTFRLKSGTPTIFIKTAESGNKRAHAFCPECGTPIYSAAPEPNPSTYGLRVGGIDQRAHFAPPAGKSGAVRRYPGQWICERSRSRTANDRRACRWRRARAVEIGRRHI